MATQNDNGFMTFTAGAVLAANRRVKLSGTSNRTIVYAGAGEKSIGVTQAAGGTGDEVAVKLFTTPGTFKVTAASAMATRNCAVYGAANGMVDDSASGGQIGYALDTASAINAIIEIAPIADLPTTVADAVATIDNDAGGTTSGTENVVALCAAIDDDAGGTNGGTEQLTTSAATCLAAIDDDAGGTNGGTEHLSAMKMTAGSAGFLTPVKNNFATLADEHNKLLVDVNALRTKTVNNFAVMADEFNELRTNLQTNLKVITTQLNAIITSLKAAGFMAT